MNNKEIQDRVKSHATHWDAFMFDMRLKGWWSDCYVWFCIFHLPWISFILGGETISARLRADIVETIDWLDRTRADG